MKRVLCLLLCIGLLGGFLFAVGQSEGDASGEKVVITHFIALSDRASSQIKSNDEMYCYQVLEDKFNIDMVFNHPPAGQTGEQFNLMVASGDLTDVITYGWLGVPGGPAKVLEDGTLVPLTAYMKEGKIPALAAFYKKYPEALKQAVTDDGEQYMFPFSRPAINLRINGGPAIRYDWLQKVGLELPTTIEEWYTALKAFKENDVNGNGDPDDEIPLFSHQQDQSLRDIFPVAWEVRKGFCVNDGRIVYGPIQPGYKDYLTEMAKWYAEGLIDPDYITNDNQARDAKMTSDRVGAIFAWMNGVLGKFNTMMADHPTFDLRGTAWPKADDGISYSGNNAWVGWVSGGGTAIGATNKNIETTLKVLDYPYTEEGNLLFNFGEEGVSYTMVDGEPRFTDLILNNPDGLAATNALAVFAHASTGVSTGFAQDARYASQIRSSIPQQAAAEIEWAKSTDGILPPPLSPPTEDSALLNKIMGEAATYVDEYTNKVIMGLSSIEDFDEFVTTLKKMGIGEAEAIMQKSYESYQAR
jgi:putative aldouronate transport system substrate-binding protein